MSRRRRLLALYVLCLGMLMVALDTTIVTVALPSIQSQLAFSAARLTWVLNAYLLTFGGFLLLGGRLGDLYGQRRLILAGLAVFTLSSAACGLAGSQLALIAARAVQGVGGAIIAAVALSLIMTLFVEPAERAMAMGVFGFIVAAGGSLGEVLGGVLTQALGWHAIFLVNLPIGIAVSALCVAVVPPDPPSGTPRSLDAIGAVTITAALVLAAYGIVGSASVGWASAQTAGLLGASIALGAIFIAAEARNPEPLMPLRLWRLRNLAAANALSVFNAAGLFAWFVTAALYLQHVLHYDPFQVGLCFLPADVLMASFSAGLSARVVVRFGIRGPLCAGMMLSAAGLALFARAPIAGTFSVDVLPGMLLLGLGSGIALNPMLLAATSDVEAHESGLASGLINTSFTLGGALGLAVLTSLADARTEGLKAVGAAPAAALNGGYHLAFLLGAILSLLAAVGSLALRETPIPAAAASAEASAGS